MKNSIFTNTPTEIIEEFRNTIDERGIMHKWIADKLGLSKTSLSNIFNGRGVLTEENRKKLNELLNTSI